MLDVITCHGCRQLHLPQRRKERIDVANCLLQVQPHIRDLFITRQTESGDILPHSVFQFLFHAAIIYRQQREFNSYSKHIYKLLKNR